MKSRSGSLLLGADPSSRAAQFLGVLCRLHSVLLTPREVKRCNKLVMDCPALGGIRLFEWVVCQVHIRLASVMIAY